MYKKKKIDRRSFIKTSTLGVVGAGTLLSIPSSFAEEKNTTKFPKIKEYRTLGRTGFKTSDIGIGTSRAYPTPVITALLDAGVNYIDTSERYGRGSSEESIGEAIKGRNRKKLFITSKLSLRGEDYTKEQVLEKFQGCLKRLQTDYIDCILIHGASTVKSLKNENFHQAIKQLKKEGKVKFTGISNHGPRFRSQGETMEKVMLGAIEDGRYDLLLLVYNFLQKEAGERVIDAASKKNIATTIMKSDPLGRYYQTKERMEEMKKEGKTPNERTIQYMKRMEETVKKAEGFVKKHNLTDPRKIKDAAIRFVLSNPKVNVLNLAFHNFDNIQDYLKLSGSRLSQGEKKTLAAFEKSCGSLYCRHACGICESSCPHQVPVNTIMRYNHYFDAHGSEKFAMQKYAGLISPKADLCSNCKGFCERVCPYGVPIQALLNQAHQQLTLA